MRKIAVIAAMLGASISCASAADIPVKAPYATATIYDWSGFYVGADVGGQFSAIGLSSPSGPLTFDPHHDSFAVGGHAGYQRQWGQFVFGVEGGYLAGFGQGQLATPAISIFQPGNTGITSAKLRDIWSIGGRIGWAPSNWMIYETVGFASGSFALDVSDQFSATEHASARPGGFYIGGGVDYAVSRNWIVGLEYRHYDFGPKSVTSTGSATFVIEQVNFDTRTDVITGRLSYKFDWSGPVVAKY